ncbi:hypothetical protein A1O7_00531 [Cladophialophora yegresii CBS 114405]|uniref:Uncharacterized protein n=1 Tax=Cladophialophora yegresii CBS 114405 TaxID=1182544 RepID=W9WGS2_9EURO|nr:uncharacterized protein A1O7_00531 [Cladophialophora yegresii CBS 114405]EXJ64195.1 hypothetical protein A1O7_00531 [Cladophialophora yegresii CBS 114405]
MSIDKISNGGQAIVPPPSHPVPQLQLPFEESMMESINDEVADDIPTDAMVRRSMLLEAPTYQRVIAGRWKQKAGEKYHPLWKLVAQLTFGMHLLSQHMAISEDEVMRILQSHVDDIDAFLERTTEDFDLAQSDIHERIRCLKLPLSHGDVFDRMLEDRAFRASILEGNEKIDHVISRTKKAAKDALKDVQKGFDATNVMDKYLSDLTSTWKRNSPEHEAVLVAMLGNVEGWRRAFLELHLQGNKLAGSLKKLAEVVSEMQLRAAAVSRNLVAQKPRHITSQAGRAPSTFGPIVDQKPLPTEPGRRQSTRNSSRSTQLTSFSSRPNTGQNSSHGMISHTQSMGLQTPQSSDSRRPDYTATSLSSASAAFDMAQHASERMLSVGGLLIRSNEQQLSELPADVPEDALRQAPVSVKNRLSMTLGLRSKDTASHRISSVYYPHALSNLLKSPGISSLLLTPEAGIKGTPVQKLVSPIMSEGEAGFSLAQGQSPSIGFVTPESRTGLNSTKDPPTGPRRSARASLHEASTPATRRSSIRGPAFTLHSSVMAMAAPPVELPAPVTDTGRPVAQEKRPSSSSSRKGSQSQMSSLGEPGPEFPEAGTTILTSVSEPRYFIDTSLAMVPVDPASVAEEIFAAAHHKVELESISSQAVGRAQQKTGTGPLRQQQTKVTPFISKKVAEARDDENPKRRIGEQTMVNGNLNPAANPELAPKGSTIRRSPSTDSSTKFVAELEAVVPKSLTVKPKKDDGPVELEAPHQTFKLPPRPITANEVTEKGAPLASINQLDDSSKHHTDITTKSCMKPKEFGGPNTAEPIRPSKVKSTKQDGKIDPVQVGSPSGTPPSATSSPKLKLKVDPVAEIIENISWTPTSPIHSRAASTASSNSAQRWSYRSSRSLGPPAQAPAPPAPGGRSMVEPDFATAGQFEGERKQKKKDSSSGVGSKIAWKAFFRHSSANSPGSTGALDSREGLSRGAATTQAPTSASAPVSPIPAADMMTTSGKDVLWFRGNGKKTLSAA